MMNRIRHLLDSFTLRLFLSHVLIAVLSGMGVALITFLMMWSSAQNISLDYYRSVASFSAVAWLTGVPEGLPVDPVFEPFAGWAVVISEAGDILWSHGETACRAGMAMQACAPEAADLEDHFFSRNGEQWAHVVVPLVTGERIVLQGSPPTVEPYVDYGHIRLTGYDELLLFEMLSRALMAIPIALLIAWLITRPTIRRLRAITHTSRQFAQGQMDARIRDHQEDDVGRLAQQFDDMADALSQNIHTLHELAQRNAELALQAEQEAIKAERTRISRDLHDAIAQRLFSLSISTTTLPDLIAKSPEQGVKQAKAVAELAEQTLLDLRALLVELRPTNLVQHGLAESLKLLFRQWQTLHQAHIEPALMLTGRHIPAAVEDAVYQITQEALSNIARHARASLVELSLVEGQRQIVLSISDNGTGFDAENPSHGAKFGLICMRERAQMFGGSLNVESEMGKGTTIQASLPLALAGEGVQR